MSFSYKITAKEIAIIQCATILGSFWPSVIMIMYLFCRKFSGQSTVVVLIVKGLRYRLWQGCNKIHERFCAEKRLNRVIYPQKGHYLQYSR